MNSAVCRMKNIKADIVIKWMTTHKPSALMEDWTPLWNELAGINTDAWTAPIEVQFIYNIPHNDTFEMWVKCRYADEYDDLTSPIYHFTFTYNSAFYNFVRNYDHELENKHYVRSLTFAEITNIIIDNSEKRYNGAGRLSADTILSISEEIDCVEVYVASFADYSRVYAHIIWTDDVTEHNKQETTHEISAHWNPELCKALLGLEETECQ